MSGPEFTGMVFGGVIVALVGGLQVVRRWRSRPRLPPADPAAFDRWYVERERERERADALRKIAAADYARQTRPDSTKD